MSVYIEYRLHIYICNKKKINKKMKAKQNSLMNALRVRINSMDVGQECVYPTDNCNFSTLKQTFYILIKENKDMIAKKFTSSWSENRDFFTITRIK